MENSIITASNGDVFRVESLKSSSCIYVVRQEYPHGGLLGLMRWDDRAQQFFIFQVGIVPWSAQLPVSRTEDAIAALQKLSAIIPQPTCGECAHLDQSRGCCRVRRDSFVSWMDCLLPVDVGDRACSRFAQLPLEPMGK